MKQSSIDLIVQTAREALVLVRGTERLEALYKRQSSITADEFAAELERIIRETADEYGPTFGDDCGEDQMFDNSELLN